MQETKMKRGMIVLIFAGLMLAACSPAASREITGDWELVSYGSASSRIPAAPGVDTLIQFKSDGTLSGNVGCNGFGGEYQVTEAEIEFSQIMSTLMFCEGPVGEQETITFKVFTETASFILEGNTLTITSADKNSVVVLARK
jgi:heat shock protein HslJ